MLEKIQNSLEKFSRGNLSENALNLFQTLGYESTRQQPFDDKSFADFAEFITDESNFNRENAFADEWQYVDLLFQLTGDELSKQVSIFKDTSIDQRITSYLFFVIELKEANYNRTKLSQITREVNKVFQIPVMILFKYGTFLTLALNDRRPNKIDENKDVLRKVTLIKDINFQNTHSAHREILKNLSLSEIKNNPIFTISNFLSLHNAWQKILDVELVTKKFFRDYKIVFDKIEVEVEKNITDKESARLYTQQLFNRLMFIYFLQKKGWLIFEGNKNYLRCLFNAAENNNENFLNDRLFWLFFSGLGANENIELHNAKLMKERRGEVPYLNGGLFEKDSDGFDERDRMEIDNRYFGDILNLFEHYHFTLEESTPIDVEIAVDPEMLGKVFEELVTGRHDSGSYYTPREIVQFMCRETLKHYLAPNDSADTIAQFVDDGNCENLSNPELILKSLQQIRICDPACGSGAYLLGMMQELLRLRESLFTSKQIGNSILYNRKREIIEQNIYGVDKDRFAVQIASLRLWLSLAIESNEPRPLPNLKYKIGCGDALLAPLENDLQSNLLRRPLIDEFRNLKAEYSNEDNSTRKSELNKKIEHLRIEIAQSLHHLPEPPKPFQITLAEKELQPLREKIQRLINSGEKFKGENEQKNLNKLLSSIEEWKKQITIEHYDTPDFFDWTVEFAEVFGDGGFDVILANPPYIQLQKDGGQLAKLYENKDFETFTRSGDIYSLFYERGFGLLKEKGVLCFITSNKWMRAGYGEKSRKFFAEKTKPLLIIDFGSVKVFSTATVDNNILILQKAEKEVGKGVLAVRTEKDFDFSQGLSAYIEQNGYQLSALSQNSWVIGEKDEFDIKSRVEKQGVPLNKWNIQINYGIKTGFNEAFIIPSKIKDELIAKDAKSADILKPILRGKDIKAWQPEFDDLWLIATFPTLNLDIEDYPIIKEYLESIGKHRLEQSGNAGSRKKTSNKWFETQDQINYWRDFEKPKIIYPNMTKYLPFIYDETGFYTNQKCFIITGESLKYLTCFFNSKLFKYCFSDNFPELQGGTRELSKIFFDKIPVKQISEDEEKPFKAIVDYIMLLKKRIQKLKAESEEYQSELVMSLFFEQLSDALVLETYLKEDFEKADVSVKEYLPEFIKLDKNDEEKSLQSVRQTYEEVELFTHPLRGNLSAMKSIPAIQIIYNTVRF